jgi:hypothetical protein
MPVTQSTATIPLDHFKTWLAFGERGISSEAIVFKLTGYSVGGSRWSSTYPRDPADFRRCQLLLNAVPLARLCLPAMRSVSPEWARLVDAWDQIHEAIQSEVPDYLGRWAAGSASIGYRLMRRLIDDGIECGDCSSTGRADACEKCKGTGRRSGGQCRASGCWNGYHSCAACRGNGYTRRAA